MDIKAGVLDRIEQSFILFKNNFIDLFLPLFLYNLISVVIFGTILMSLFFSNIGNIMNGGLDFFGFLNNSYVVLSIAIGMVIFILYLILYIPILLGLIKSIKQATEGVEITSKENVIYGFNRLTDSFKTYWYIFSYVALIPSFFFILGGIMFNVGFYIDGADFLQQIGGFLMIIGGILFLVFIIYRGLKASFPIYSAVNSDNFTKNNFLNAVNITNEKWYRIAGNFLLVGLIISLISGLISGILSIINYSGIDFGSIRSPEDIIGIAGEFSITTQILSSFLNNILNTVGIVFTITFTYLFFLRLNNESNLIVNNSYNNGITKL